MGQVLTWGSLTTGETILAGWLRSGQGLAPDGEKCSSRIIRVWGGYTEVITKLVNEIAVFSGPTQGNSIRKLLPTSPEHHLFH